MKLLDRQVLLELAGPFLFGVAAFTSIFFAGNYLLKLTNDVLRGMPTVAAAQLLILYLPGVVVLTLPMSALLATLQAFGRLSSDSEIVALYSSGVSLKRIALPVAAMGIAVSLVSFALNEAVVPRARVLSQEVRARALKESVKPRQAFSYVEKQGDVTTNIVVHGGVDIKNRTMSKVTVVQYRGEQPFVFFKADRAVWEGGDKWTLHEGYLKTLDQETTQVSKFRELKTEVIEIRRSPREMALNQRDPEDMSIKELAAHIRARKLVGVETQKLEVGLYNKVSLPFASLIFAMLGLPLGVRPHRSGSSYGMGLAVLIILLYWLVWHYMTALGNQGSVPPALGAFTADILGLAGAVALLSRAAK